MRLSVKEAEWVCVQGVFWQDDTHTRTVFKCDLPRPVCTSPQTDRWRKLSGRFNKQVSSQFCRYRNICEAFIQILAEMEVNNIYVVYQTDLFFCFFKLFIMNFRSWYKLLGSWFDLFCVDFAHSPLLCSSFCGFLRWFDRFNYSHCGCLLLWWLHPPSAQSLLGYLQPPVIQSRLGRVRESTLGFCGIQYL